MLSFEVNNTMSENTKTNFENTVTQTVLNVVLMMVESLFTLLLRFDANLRKIVYPLAKDNVVVCIRTYVPHITFYATFSYHGVLLDSQLQQNQQVDVTINTFTWQLAQVIMTHDVKVVDKLQMRGDANKVEQVKNFLLAVGLGQAVQNLLQLVKNKNKKTEEEQLEKKSIDDYKQRINEQKTQIQALTIRQEQLNTALQEMQSKNKILKVSLAVTMVIAIICAMGWILL